MQQPSLARAGPPPPSGRILRAADNEPSSCWRKAVENGDPLRGVILGALRGTYIYTLLDWHCTSHPQSRNSAIYAAVEMPVLASEKNLTSLFRALSRLASKDGNDFFVCRCACGWPAYKSCYCFSSRRGTVALFIQKSFSKKEIFKTFSRWSTLPPVRCYTP